MYDFIIIRTTCHTDKLFSSSLECYHFHLDQYSIELLFVVFTLPPLHLYTFSIILKVFLYYFFQFTLEPCSCNTSLYIIIIVIRYCHHHYHHFRFLCSITDKGRGLVMVAPGISPKSFHPSSTSSSSLSE